MHNTWMYRGIIECTEQRLCDQNKQILDKKLLTEAEIQAAQKLAEKDEIKTPTSGIDADNPPDEEQPDEQLPPEATVMPMHELDNNQILNQLSHQMKHPLNAYS